MSHGSGGEGVAGFGFGEFGFDEEGFLLDDAEAELMELGVAKLVALEEDALFVDFFGDANEAGVVGNGFEAAEDAAPVEAGEGLELGLAGAEADDGVGEFEGFGAAKFGGVCFGPGAGALHAVGDLTVQVGEDLGVTAAEVVEG